MAATPVWGVEEALREYPDAGSDKKRHSAHGDRCNSLAGPALGRGTPAPLETKCDREPPEDDRGAEEEGEDACKAEDAGDETDPRRPVARAAVAPLCEADPLPAACKSYDNGVVYLAYLPQS
jgi:hypothetical protein